MAVSAQGDRSPLFVRLADGEIQNGFTVKISNKNPAPMEYRLTVDGLPDATIKVIGADPQALRVESDTVGPFRMLMKAPLKNLNRKTNDITIKAVNVTTGEESHHDAIFNAPGR